MKRPIPILTRSNCFLVVLHSMNIWLMLDRLKTREGRSKKCSRRWIIFVSPQKNVKNTHGWVLDKGIQLGHMYVLAYIVGFERAVGYYKWDWVLEVHGLKDPVPCPPVGLSNQSPRVEHDAAMHALNTQLSAMQMTRVWSFAEEPVLFADLAEEVVIPLDMVQCYTSVKHVKWDKPMDAGMYVWYTLKSREDPSEWFASEGTMRVQVKVLGHIFVCIEPVPRARIVCMR
jgi:hypothetical protein